MAGTKTKKPSDKPYKYVNFKKVIDETGLNQDKVYNNLKDEYDSLTPADKKKIIDVLFPNLKQVFNNFGYELELRQRAA